MPTPEQPCAVKALGERATHTGNCRLTLQVHVPRDHIEAARADLEAAVDALHYDPPLRQLLVHDVLAALYTALTDATRSRAAASLEPWILTTSDAAAMTAAGIFPPEPPESPLPGNEMAKDKELVAGYTCQVCGKYHEFPGYVFAHYDEELRHTCECKSVHYIRSGRARLIRKGKKPKDKPNE